jgi:PAS domain S-box-containing protein
MQPKAKPKLSEGRAGSSKGDILIVDDTPANLRVLINILDEQGYKIHPASEGSLALRFADASPPDLILLDIMMPNMDGFEVSKRLKANERTRDIPVIFISSADQILDKVKAFSSGGVDYITKPFQSEEVIARIETHLSLQKLRTSLEERVRERTRELEEANERLHDEIIERKRSEEALRASEERYRVLYRDNPSMFFTLDSTGQIVSVNEFGASQLGYTIDELLGQSVLMIFHEDEHRTVKDQLQLCLQNPWQIYHWQLRKVRKDRSQLWVEEFARAVNGSGDSFNLLVVCQDITARKQAEAQQLELVLAQERADTLKELLNTLSHDLKTPLTVINTSLYLLEKAPEAVHQKRNLEQIKSQTQQLENLIQDILTVSRLDSMPDRDFQLINLNQIVRDIYEQLQAVIEERRLTVTFELDKTLPPVQANEVGIHRALVNLIENAIHYTLPEGTVTVRTFRHADRAVIEVCDTGIGMDEHDMRHIFEHFYRADQARATNRGGTGLGLAIVKKIIDIHGGSIEVESTPGQGSTFRVQLRLE